MTTDTQPEQTGPGGNPVMVSIVIPAYNQLEYCRQCVASIQRNTAYPYRLILVDNGSTDGVGAFFDSVAGAVVVHTGGNLGFAGGVNAGLAHAEGHVLLLNSDTVAPRGWLGRMVAALESDPRIGLLGPVSNCVSGSQQIDGLELDSMEAMNAYADGRARSHAGRVRDVARLVGFCLLIRDSVFRLVGKLDEAYGIGNFEDDDYCMRVMRAGYRLCVAEDCFVFHYGSRTFLAMGIVEDSWNELLERNEAIFARKWDARPEERSDAARQAAQKNHEAQLARERNDLTAAAALLAEAIRLAPPAASHHNDLGAVLWELGERERAFRAFVSAVRLDPALEAARCNLSDAAAVLGREEEARALLGEDEARGESSDGD